MDREHGTRRSAIQALQNALLISPSTDTEKATIFSTNPSVWGEQHHVINVGPLLNVRPMIVGHPEDIEGSTAAAFQAAGWPSQRIVEEFRPDFKSPIRIDIALLDEAGECLVAIETKRNTGPEWQRRVREAWIQLQHNAPKVLWHCVTDGTTFYLRRNGSEQRIELGEAFSPESLQTGDFTRKTLDSAPKSFGELRDWLKGYHHVVLDHTIPIVRLEQASRSRASLEQELGGALPPFAELLHGFLAWIARQEEIQTVSTFGTHSLLRGETTQWLRNELEVRFAVRGVVEVGGLFETVHTAMRFCIVQLSKTAGPAILENITGDPAKGLDHYAQAARQFSAGKNPVAGFVADVTGRWAVSLYDPELNKLEERLAGIGLTKPLSEICTIVRGLPLTQETKNVPQGVPLATRVRQVEDPGSLPDNVRKIALTPENERLLLRPGDVVVSAIKGVYLQCALVRSDTPLVASAGLFIVRINDAGLTPEFLVEYLNSSLARRLIDERYAGSAGLTLTVRSLGNLPVPLLGRPVALDLREIGTVEAALRRRADELQLDRQSLFEATSTQGFTIAVQDLRRKGELLSRSLLRADDLSFQIANFYPFPIAYGYRLLASISNPSDLYKEQLRVGENILAFLASVALCLIQPEDRTSVGLDVCEVWDGGASPGHWRDIVGKCCKVLSTYKDHPLAASIVGLHITAEKKGFGGAVQRMIVAKNDFKHDRGPRTEEDFETATKELQGTLDACIKALGFFTEYPIRQVLDFDITRAGQVTLRCLALVGDHPGLPQEEIVYRSPLTKRDLYIEAAGIGWVSLFPLLVARNCRACKTRETFFLDKWNRKKGTAMRKSFERGHEEETNEVIQNFKGWLDAAPKREQNPE